MSHEIKNIGDAIAVFVAAWNAFISAVPTLISLCVLAYSIMRVVNEWPAFSKTVKGWFGRK